MYIYSVYNVDYRGAAAPKNMYKYNFLLLQVGMDPALVRGRKQSREEGREEGGGDEERPDLHFPFNPPARPTDFSQVSVGER